MINRLPLLCAVALCGCYCAHVPSTDAGAPDAARLDGGASPDAGREVDPPLDPTPWGVRPTQIDVSDRHACAVLEDGRVVCWGSSRGSVLGPDSPDGCDRGALRSTGFADDFVLEPTVVPGVADAVEVAVGQVTSCARTSAGEVWCWGRQNDDTCRLTTARRLEGLADVVQLRGSAVNGGFCAAHGDGGVSCWDLERAPARIAGLTGVTELSVGGWGACASVGGDLVRCFDDVAFDGAFLDYAVDGARGVVAIDTESLCVLERAGNVRCWASGRQPFGGTTGDEPRDVPGLPPVVGLDLDIFESACAWTAEGAVFCWGENERGQLGDGTAARRERPGRVLGIDDATQVSLGQGWACALRGSGGVACWGTGWLGNGEALHHYEPVDVVGVADAVGVSLRDSESCAIDAAGGARCWGTGSFAPSPARGLELAALSVRGAVHEACGRWCVALEDGTLECPVGDLFRDGFVDLGGVTELACGRQHDCVVTGGAVRCAGFGGRGELGDGVAAGESRLGEVIAFADEIVELAAGDSHTCARSRRGDVHCWGGNRVGQAGAPPAEAQATPVFVASDADRIVAGGDTSCLARGDSWSCWGRLSTIRALCGPACDLPYESDVEVPVPFRVDRLAISSGLSCVASPAQPVRCSGHPSVIRGRPSGTTDAVMELVGTEGSVDLAATREHACAVAADGRVRCWGFNGAGQLGGVDVGSHLRPVPVTPPE